MQGSPLLRYVDPSLIDRDPPLPDEHNALFPLRPATRCLQSLDEVDELASQLADDCECGESTCLACHPLDAAEFDRRTIAVLRANGESLGYVREALDRSSIQIPLQYPSLDDEVLSLQNSRTLARLLLLENVVSRQRSDWNRVATNIDELLRFGKLIASGGLAVSFLVGVAIQGIALAEIDRAVEHNRDRTVLGRLQQSLRHVVGVAEVVAVLRRELVQWALPSIEKILADSVIDQVIEFGFPSHPMIPESDWVDDGRLAQRRDQIIALLADHPNLWDPAATVQALSAFTVAQIAAANAAEIEWATGQLVVHSPNWTNATSEWWPEPLSPRVPYEALGETPDAERFRAEFANELAAMMVGAGAVCCAPLAGARLAQARQNVRAIDNPLGQLLAESLYTSAPFAGWNTLVERTAPVRQKLAALGADRGN